MPSFLEVFEKIEGKFSKTDDDAVVLTREEWSIIKDYMYVEPAHETDEESFNDIVDDLKKEVAKD